MVITVNGKRGLHHLPEQYKRSNLVSFENSVTLKAQSYFNSLYELLKVRTFGKLREIYNIHPNYQFIFLGHSIGGAVSTLLAYGAVRNNFLHRTLDSPVLITFGQPRTGNDVLANEVMLSAQLIFRVVRQGDPMVSTPHCLPDDSGTKCRTQLIDGKFQPSKPHPKGNKFDNSADLPSSELPWHIGGLKLFNHAMSKYNDCEMDSGEFTKGNPCHVEKSDDFVLHRLYFPGNLISEICRTHISVMHKHKANEKETDPNLAKAEEAARIAQDAMRTANEAANIAREELQKVQMQQQQKEIENKKLAVQSYRTKANRDVVNKAKVTRNRSSKTKVVKNVKTKRRNSGKRNRKNKGTNVAHRNNVHGTTHSNKHASPPQTNHLSLQALLHTNAVPQAQTNNVIAHVNKHARAHSHRSHATNNSPHIFRPATNFSRIRN